MSQVAQTTTQLNDLVAKEQELREKQRQLKKLQKDREWEAKTKARNPAFVVGSLRKPTPSDLEALGHCHGEVCEIQCLECGETRVINRQDAFQVKFCKECVAEVRKAAAKAKRVEKRVEGRSVEELEAQIAALNDQISQMA